MPPTRRDDDSPLEIDELMSVVNQGASFEDDENQQEQQAAEQEQESEEQPQQDQEREEATEETETPPTPPESPAARQPSETEQLRQELRDLRAAQAQERAEYLATLREMRSPRQESQEPARQQPQRVFNMRVPPEINQMLASEDENIRAQGLTTLINGLGDVVYNRVMQDVPQYVQPLVQQTVQGTTSQQGEAQAIYQDFYGAYPALNKPELRPLVASVAQQMMREQGGNPSWNESFRNALGQRVLEVVRNLGGTPAPSQPGSPAGGGGTPPAAGTNRPPRQVQRGARGNSGGPSAVADFIRQSI